LPGRNANAYSDPHAFTYRNSDTDSDPNGDNHTTSNSYAYADSDAVADPHPASADAKAATNAVSSTDAVSGWIRKLKELKSYRELARQLASSLLCGGVTHYAHAFWSAAVLRRF
jgi:hypothetical protein